MANVLGTTQAIGTQVQLLTQDAGHPMTATVQASGGGGGGGLTLLAEEHRVGETGSIAPVVLIPDIGLVDKTLLFSCQMTVTTVAGSAANAALHVGGMTTHGQNSSQASELSPPGGGSTMVINLAQPGDTQALVQSKYVDAGSPVQYQVDADPPDGYEYAVDILIYELPLTP